MRVSISLGRAFFPSTIALCPYFLYRFRYSTHIYESSKCYVYEFLFLGFPPCCSGWRRPEAGESASVQKQSVQLKKNGHQQQCSEAGDSGILPQEHLDQREASRVLHPENLLVFHSLKAGTSGEDVLKAVRKLVPARTVLGSRDATASEASALGLAGTSSRSGGPVFVVEFSSGVNAR